MSKVKEVLCLISRRPEERELLIRKDEEGLLPMKFKFKPPMAGNSGKENWIYISIVDLRALLKEEGGRKLIEEVVRDNFTFLFPKKVDRRISWIRNWYGLKKGEYPVEACKFRNLQEVIEMVGGEEKIKRCTKRADVQIYKSLIEKALSEQYQLVYPLFNC